MSAKEITERYFGYKPDKEAVNRYMRAEEAYENRVGNAVKAKFNWQRIAFISMTICLISVIGIIFMSVKATVVPCVITVNNDGIPTVIGKADIKNFIPGDKEIHYFLGQIIYKARAVPIDPILAQRNWKELYSFMDKNAGQKMMRIQAQEKPNLKFGKETVDVKIDSIVPFSEKDTYQIRWKELTFDYEGLLLEEKKMSGLFTIRCVPPKELEKILVNPLGLYVKDFNWSPDV